MAEECIRKVSEEIKELYSLYEKRSDDEYTAFFVLYRLCDIHYDIKKTYRDFDWISEFWENGTLNEMIEICDTTIQKRLRPFFEIMKKEKVRYAESPNFYWCMKFTSVNGIYDGKLADVPELEKINENLEALGMGKILSLAEEQLTEIKTYLGKFGGMRHFLEYGLRSSDITIDEDGLSYIDRDYVEVVEHINFLLKEEEGAVNNVCEMDFNKRKRKNLILEGKDALGTLKEMQNEVAKNLMDYEYLKDIFLEYIDEATLNFNLYSLFVKLYICNDKTKQLFLEKCIRYKWCRDKMAELSKEEEKAKFESIGEEDMVLLERLKGYIDKVSEVNEGKLWKSPFDGEKAKEFLEECFCDSEMGAEFRSFCKKGDSGNTGGRELVAIANVLGYLMSKGKLDAKHEAISEASTGYKEKLKQSLKKGKGYENTNSGGSKDFKDTIVPFMDSKLK